MPPRDPPADLVTKRQGAPVPLDDVGFDVAVLGGPDAGAHVALDAGFAGKVLVGTGPLCELRLKDPTVSRRHAALELTDRGLLLTDLGSTNGTYVNDASVAGAYVRA